MTPCTPHTRRDFLKRTLGQTGLALGLPLVSRATGLSGGSGASPNFVFILSDDQGWNGTSVRMDAGRPDSMSDYHFTPNLARLASRGMRFSNGYSPAALCCPTRRSIQFGQTPARMGYERFPQLYPKGNRRPTIPRILKSVNSDYAAAHFGKWDLRTDLAPEDLGYDESDGNTNNRVGSQGSDFDNKEKWKKFKELDDPKRIFSLTDRAIDFMQRQVRAGRPFYLQVSHYAVHVDIQTRPESYRKYAGKEKGKLHKIPAFAGMTEDLDTGLGKVLDKIEELGIADNTFVFYLADNGAVPWIPPDQVKHFAPPLTLDDKSRNYPLRSGKWTLYEGGVRVPCLAQGPGIAANSVSSVPVIGWDLLPTIADLAGYSGSLPGDLDGGSIKELLLKGGSGSVLRPFEGFVFHRYSDGDPHSSIRLGNFKLIKFWKTKERLLFDLDQDLGETKDLSQAMPQKAEELHQKLMDYLKAVSAEILAQE